jgi:hypothetical protein
MRLKLLLAAIPLVLATGGCVVHFPLADNTPSLASQEDSPASTSSMSSQPTEPDTRSPVTTPAPETPNAP